MIRIKVIQRGMGATPSIIERAGCQFIYDAACREYDWLVVYDELPRNLGSICNEAEPLACPRERTILVTQEPPSIKIYPKCYTSQFGYVLTTHTPQQLPHPNHRYGEGCLYWCAGIPAEEAFRMPDYPKSKTIACICSAKQQTHTLHSKRYNLVKYLASRIPELEWYGWGVKKLDKKYDAQNDFRYTLAIENYVAPYHWTDKISDPLLSLCLTFYVGDPRLEEVFPAESFIRIPLENPEEAYRIIKEAIDNNEYEKRLPAIKEARRRLIETHNFFNTIAAIATEQQNAPAPAAPAKPYLLKGRHRLRKNPLNLLTEGWELLRYKLGFTKS